MSWIGRKKLALIPLYRPADRAVTKEPIYAVQVVSSDDMRIYHEPASVLHASFDIMRRIGGKWRYCGTPVIVGYNETGLTKRWSGPLDALQARVKCYSLSVNREDVRSLQRSLSLVSLDLMKKWKR